MQIKIRNVILAMLVLAARYSQGQGYIVANGVVTNLFPGDIDLNWPQQTQVNGFSLTPVGTHAPSFYMNIFNFNEPATIGVRVFEVQYNDPITYQSITSQGWTELTYPNNYLFRTGTPFYVGLYSGASVAPPYPPNPPYTYTDPVFGWAELENVQGHIELLDGDLEYGGAGIYAGTLNIIPIPEPSTSALLALAGGILAVCVIRKRKMHANK